MVFSSKRLYLSANSVSRTVATSHKLGTKMHIHAELVCNEKKSFLKPIFQKLCLGLWQTKFLGEFCLHALL